MEDVTRPTPGAGGGRPGNRCLQGQHPGRSCYTSALPPAGQTSGASGFRRFPSARVRTAPKRSSYELSDSSAPSILTPSAQWPLRRVAVGLPSAHPWCAGHKATSRVQGLLPQGHTASTAALGTRGGLTPQKVVPGVCGRSGLESRFIEPVALSSRHVRATGTVRTRRPFLAACQARSPWTAPLSQHLAEAGRSCRRPLACLRCSGSAQLEAEEQRRPRAPSRPAQAPLLPDQAGRPGSIPRGAAQPVGVWKVCREPPWELLAAGQWTPVLTLLLKRVPAGRWGALGALALGPPLGTCGLGSLRPKLSKTAHPEAPGAGGGALRVLSAVPADCPCPSAWREP